MIYLIIGICGTGKTWIMKELAKAAKISTTYSYKTGMYVYLKKDGIILLGKFDGTMFEGSDRLSMAIMSDNDKVAKIFKEARIVIGEGDRFTNSTFLKDFQPTVLRIKGDGVEGRIKRGSSQTERHLKSITTRVQNMEAHLEFDDSTACLNYLLSVMEKPAS